ncbi:MAG: heavy-metal-associated domain-containing protein [Thermodesulfobacteriota bacterium]
MNQEIFSIPNISCGHCTSAVKSELEELDGVLTPHILCQLSVLTYTFCCVTQALVGRGYLG